MLWTEWTERINVVREKIYIKKPYWVIFTLFQLTQYDDDIFSIWLKSVLFFFIYFHCKWHFQLQLCEYDSYTEIQIWLTAGVECPDICILRL